MMDVTHKWDCNSPLPPQPSDLSKPRYRLGHPKIYLLYSTTFIFTGSKYLNNILFIGENKFTATHNSNRTLLYFKSS